jgi:hypothetical protein
VSELSWNYTNFEHVSSYREVPPFGKDAVRRFPESASEMKRMTARDLENLLQVSTLIVAAVLS